MSGECDECGEHTLECVCKVKDFSDMRKQAEAFYFELIEQRQQELIERVDRVEKQINELINK